MFIPVILEPAGIDTIPTSRPEINQPEVEPEVQSEAIVKTRQIDKTYAIVSGTASTYGDGYAGFLALPEGGGIRVKVCGPATCIIRISNDAGPNKAMQRKGRVIDLNSRDFNIVCGCSWNVKGTVEVTVGYLR